MTIINLFIKLILSIVITYLILANYKRIKLNKKYALVLFALGVVLFCIDVLVKTTFVSKTIISTIILAIINPIEVSIWIYLGICILTKIKRFKNILKLVLLYLFFMFVYENMLLLFNVSLIYESHSVFNFIACIISTIIFSYLFLKLRIENISIYIFNSLIIIETIIVILGYDYVVSNFYQSTYDGKLPRKLVEISYTLLKPFSSIISIPVAYNCTVLVLLLIPMYFIMLSFLKVKKNNRN